MRERIKDKDRLEHILKSLTVLLANKDKYTLEQVENDSLLFFGFVKHLEIIGEAVYKLTKEFRENHPEVEWIPIEGMRHILVHGYYQIDPAQLWDTIQNDLDELQTQIQKLYEEEIIKTGD